MLITSSLRFRNVAILLPSLIIPVTMPSIPLSSQQSFPKLSLQEQVRAHGLEYDEEGYLTWPRGDVGHPRNWPLRRKVFDSTIIMFLDFITTAISTAGSTAVIKGGVDHYKKSTTFSIFAFTSMYVTTILLICASIVEAKRRINADGLDIYMAKLWEASSSHPTPRPSVGKPYTWEACFRMLLLRWWSPLPQGAYGVFSSVELDQALCLPYRVSL